MANKLQGTADAYTFKTLNAYDVFGKNHANAGEPRTNADGTKEAIFVTGRIARESDGKIFFGSMTMVPPDDKE